LGVIPHLMNSPISDKQPMSKTHHGSHCDFWGVCPNEAVRNIDLIMTNGAVTLTDVAINVSYLMSEKGLKVV